MNSTVLLQEISNSFRIIIGLRVFQQMIIQWLSSYDNLCERAAPTVEFNHVLDDEVELGPTCPLKVRKRSCIKNRDSTRILSKIVQVSYNCG